MSPRTLLIAVLLSACAAGAQAAQCRAVVIVGDPGEDGPWPADFAHWGAAWRELLIARGAAAGDVRLLTTPPKAERERAAAGSLATRGDVIAALADLARACAPEDQAVVVLIGHAYQSQEIGKFCLAGPDLTAADAATALKPLRASRAALLFLAPEGEPWAESLSGKGRVVVCANLKQSAPCFGEFLLRAVASGGNLLDAFNTASLATLGWYQNQFQQEHEKVPTVHGHENQDVFRAVYPGAEFRPGDERPHHAINDIHRNLDFRGRRVLVEVAGLEDDGDGKASSCYAIGLEPTALDGNGDGKVARELFLGKP